MPTFPYVARTSEGTLERGVIDAPTAESARSQLHKKGWTIEELAGDTGISFSEAPAWTVMPERSAPKKAASATVEQEYLPLLQTLRLFAGWLMAWYGIIFIAGNYRSDGRLPYDIPLIQSLAASDLVLRFALAVFLFLLLTDVYRWSGKKAIVGVLLAIVGGGSMWLFHMNV